MRTRAYRRQQRDKRKRKFRQVLTRWGLANSADHVGRRATTPHPCSCWGCGNPRKHFNRCTRQEERSALAISEYYESNSGD